jgi:cold shock CspA family protein
MSKGKVKFFNQTKGFGFIKDNETEKNTLYMQQG